MKRYYEKHKCEKCGCYYMAWSESSKVCTDCLNEREHHCVKCGKVYQPKSLDSQYCTAHRYLQSPAYLNKYSKRRSMTEEEKEQLKLIQKKKANERKAASRALHRQSKEPKEPRAPKDPKPTRVNPHRKITEAVFFSQQVRAEAPAPVAKPVDKFFLRTGPKTVYGFTSRERLDKFKKRNGIA